jgi:S1-C subfamily serine protease
MYDEYHPYDQYHPKTKRTTRNRYIAAFTGLAIVAMFITGYVVGGSYNTLTTTSPDVQQLQNQVNNLQQQVSSSKTQYVQSITTSNVSLAAIYENAKDAIVVISGTVAQQSFFGTSYGSVQGSGFVYEKNGETVIITNDHVVQDATNITVTFADGDAYPATVRGSDAYSDLAVLTVQGSNEDVIPLDIASSTSLQVGDPVIAIGSPFGLSGTMTTGIISQLGRTLQDEVAGGYPIANIIQTSVPINPGNSGGPLLSYQGQVIGITTAIVQNSNSLGFAIPSNTLLREVPSLITTGSYPDHAYLGVSGTDMNYALAKTMGVSTTYGWLISQVTKGGAADQAGLQGGNHRVQVNGDIQIIGGDIITAIDGTRIVNGDAFMSYLEERTTPNQTISLTIIRDDQQQTVQVKLGQRPVIQ